MFFHKFPLAANFEFSTVSPDGALPFRNGPCQLRARTLTGGVHHVRVTGDQWDVNHSAAGLPATETPPADSTLVFADDRSVRLEDAGGNCLLASLPGRFFGRCGPASIFEFIREEGDQFYGLGEKWTGFEHSDLTTKFWNTDVWQDFNSAAYIHGRPAPDPVYVSVPYLIVRRRGRYLGLLLDNPHATFVSTGVKSTIADQMDVDSSEQHLAEILDAAAADTADGPRPHRHPGTIRLGADEGQPNLYIFAAPSLPELTRTFQRFIGTTPRPPAWALGYHQCRWGYESEADLRDLDAKFREHGIPADGLWLDIDYMLGYRVFTLDPKHFTDPAATLAELSAAGRHVVPIIDPGVKLEPGYDIYDRGRAASVFCENPQGLEFVGMVWPGQTVFPDFSLPSARAWWADEVAAFASLGFRGAWLDMNDPATGAADTRDMLFDHGTKPHATYHNQYALGMAIATRDGFLKAHPEHRPFLLSRSGCLGSTRYAAIWTGDNYSNYHHLENGVATTLNLALSGIPFNGPDAGGFGGDTTPALIRDWFKAGFLFPVFRNHSMLETRRQEPWAFDEQTLTTLGHFIKLRYRLRLYLYQLFIEHETTGDAILRPLFYDFDDTPDLPLGLIADQFLVGPSILQAPFLREDQPTRDVILPGDRPWYDLAAATWRPGNQRITATAAPDSTPIYVRDQSILPLARLAPEQNEFDATRVDFHVFLATDQTATIRYVIDDGDTLAYQRGESSVCTIEAARHGEQLAIRVDHPNGPSEPDFTFTTLPEITGVSINGQPARAIPPQGLTITTAETTTWSA